MPSSSASLRAMRPARSALARRSVARDLGDPGGDLAQRRGRLFMRGGQAAAVVVAAGRGLLEFLVSSRASLARDCACSRASARRPSSSLAAATRLRAAPTCPRSLASRSARAAAARACAASRRSAPARAASAASRAPVAAVSCSRAASSRSPQRCFLFAQRGGFGFELVRVAAWARRLRLGHQVGVALLRDPADPAQALGERGEGEPCLLRLRQPWRVFLLGGIERGLLPPGLCQGLLELPAPRQRHGLIASARVQVGGGGDVVVGEQAQPGVAQVRLDGGGAPGERRLPAERPQLAAQLAGEIDQPGQVGLHRLQLAERLLLAPAVLEYPGRLLDQRAACLGPGLQHVVQMALAHDDVHLPAEAGVGQQFRDVEQAALVAVDGVLALARAEQRPRLIVTSV